MCSGWIHDSRCTTVRWMEACSAWWVTCPSCTKACGQFKSWAIVAWASYVFGIPQSWWAQVNHILLLSLSPFSAGHTLLRKIPHKAGAPSSSFFHWLDWLPQPQAGRSCLWTLPVPCDVGPLWYHNQVFSHWSDCVSTSFPNIILQCE
jgi:hypothetical protein